MRTPAALKFCALPIISLLLIGVVTLRSKEASPASISTLSTLPPVMLWAWERPERLDFIDTNKVGVAFLAKTLFLHADQVVQRPRLQPLKLAEGTMLVAVVRIESRQPSLSSSQLETAAVEIGDVIKLPNVVAVQIDFDAKVSEREFYRQLLTRIRYNLPDRFPLSITALASWCTGDNWISTLPIDEAIPMFFRLGVDKQQFQSQLASSEDFLKNPCRSAAGISTDESVRTPNVGRLYIFNPSPWTRASLVSVMEAYKR